MVISLSIFFSDRQDYYFEILANQLAGDVYHLIILSSINS